VLLKLSRKEDPMRFIELLDHLLELQPEELDRIAKQLREGTED
jgi:hypothetical protein